MSAFPTYLRRIVMQKSLIVAVAVVVGLGASTAPALTSLVHAEGMASEGKAGMKDTGKSLTEATGKLQTDANKTKDDARHSTSRKPRRAPDW